MTSTTTPTLRDKIAAAYHELQLARRDGAAERISKAARQLDDLLDELPRPT